MDLLQVENGFRNATFFMLFLTMLLYWGRPLWDWEESQTDTRSPFIVGRLTGDKINLNSLKKLRCKKRIRKKFIKVA